MEEEHFDVSSSFGFSEPRPPGFGGVLRIQITSCAKSSFGTDMQRAFGGRMGRCSDVAMLQEVDLRLIRSLTASQQGFADAPSYPQAFPQLDLDRGVTVV